MKNKKYTLANCEMIHKQNPDTFHLPDTNNIKPGDCVKLIFDNVKRLPGERLWVLIKEINGNKIIGTINSFPMFIDIDYEDKISFSKKHICAIMKFDK